MLFAICVFLVQADNARKLQIALKIAVKRDELQITRVEIEKSQNL